MNLSIETKLAATLGASFVALVLGAIAQTQNDGGSAGSNQYALTDYPTSVNPSRKEFQSLPSRGRTQENAKTSLSNDIDQGPAFANEKKEKASKFTKRASEEARLDHSYDD